MFTTDVILSTIIEHLVSITYDLCYFNTKHILGILFIFFGHIIINTIGINNCSIVGVHILFTHL